MHVGILQSAARCLPAVACLVSAGGGCLLSTCCCLCVHIYLCIDAVNGRAALTSLLMVKSIVRGTVRQGHVQCVAAHAALRVHALAALHGVHCVLVLVVTAPACSAP
jgi:hypothetical protein